MNIKAHWYLWLSAAVLLLALGNHPYSYYQILRWIVSASAAYTAYQAYEKKQTGWAWIFAVVAILFNPIVPITMTRESWQVFDIVGVIIFGGFAVKSK